MTFIVDQIKTIFKTLKVSLHPRLLNSFKIDFYLILLSSKNIFCQFVVMSCLGHFPAYSHKGNFWTNFVEKCYDDATYHPLWTKMWPCWYFFN